MSALSCIVSGVRDDLLAGRSVEEAARTHGVDVGFVCDLAGDWDFLCPPNPDVEAHYLGDSAPLFLSAVECAAPVRPEIQPASLPF